MKKMETIEIGPFEFHDKIPLKKGFAKKKIRVVPHAIARYGSYINKNVILKKKPPILNFYKKTA